LLFLPLAEGPVDESHLGFVEVVDERGLRSDVGEQVNEKLLNT
jgi:hypothetical protein